MPCKYGIIVVGIEIDADDVEARRDVVGHRHGLPFRASAVSDIARKDGWRFRR